MCVIISGETQPDTTKLMNIPVIIDGVVTDKYNFFMYINNFDLQQNQFIKKDIYTDVFLHFNSDGNNYKRNNDKFSDRFSQSINLSKPFNSQLLSNNSYDGNYASFQSGEEFIQNDNNNNDNNNSIMVVPFPVNPHTSSSKIGLVDITTDDMKELRTNIKSLKPLPKYFSNSFSADSYSLSRSMKPLEVHKIGNYNISVATSLDQLLERIDWTKFNKPNNFNERVNTFKNPKLYPIKYAYFYVVASAIKNIKDDGFGIVYPQLDENITYIPTAHEDTENEPDFDVEIYNLNFKLTYDGVETKKRLHKLLEKLKNQPIKMLNNVYKKMSYDSGISSYDFIEYKQKMKNFNLFLTQ
jgi:hypothetical protein